MAVIDYSVQIRLRFVSFISCQNDMGFRMNVIRLFSYILYDQIVIRDS